MNTATMNSPYSFEKVQAEILASFSKPSTPKQLNFTDALHYEIYSSKLTPFAKGPLGGLIQRWLQFRAGRKYMRYAERMNKKYQATPPQKK